MKPSLRSVLMTLGASVGATALVALGALAFARAASDLRSLEVWGLTSKDELIVDGTPIPVRPRSGSERFRGEPMAQNASAQVQLSLGVHEIVLQRPGCAPRTFTLTMEGALPRTLLVEAPGRHCALPSPPARAK